jgi:nucleoside-diphosphate-sugar epimerase
MQILVIGGTNFIGRHLVNTLIKGGHETTILHRKPNHDFGKKVINLQGDRNEVASLRSQLSGKSFDAVYDLAYDWERGTPAPAVQSLAHLLTGNCGRYVFMSSVAAYGDGLNHHEGDALADDDHHDRYARDKAQTERALFRLHQRHGTPVVTIRPPFVYGPGNPYYREQFFWDRIRDRRPIILPGDGRRLMQFVFVKDLVAALIATMSTPNTVGHAFNVANSRALTQAEVVEMIARAAGKTAEVVRVPRERILRSGGHPMGPNLYFGQYFDLPPITTLVAKAQRVLRFKPVTFADGLAETYKWYQRHQKRTGIDYGFEDSLLTRASAQLAS